MKVRSIMERSNIPTMERSNIPTMERSNFSRAIPAGIVATLAMTLFGYIAPRLGLPRMDFAAMLGSLVNDGLFPETGSGTWWFGMILQFLLGAVVFAWIYANLLQPVLPGSSWLKGATWGAILWFIWQALVMPVVGYGFFSAADPERSRMVLGSLIAYLLYGGILGAIAKPRAAWSVQERPEYRPGLHRPEQERPEQYRAEQYRPVQERPVQERLAQDRPEQERPEQHRPIRPSSHPWREQHGGGATND
jgi:hypothetical protein